MYIDMYIHTGIYFIQSSTTRTLHQLRLQRTDPEDRPETTPTPVQRNRRLGRRRGGGHKRIPSLPTVIIVIFANYKYISLVMLHKPYTNLYVYIYIYIHTHVATYSHIYIYTHT